MGIDWRNERRKIADLKGHKQNPRTFTKKGMDDLMESIQAVGYIDQVAINTDNTIIGGHARVKTLIEMGYTEIDVRVPTEALTESQVKEALIRLNRNTAGAWNFEMLKDEFEQQDLIKWGFDESEFNTFGKKETPAQDDTPPIPSVAATRRGDQWLLGTHTIRCGDSTMEQDVKALLGGKIPHLMVTDPPYGVEYDASWREGHDLNVGKKIGGKYSGRSVGKVENDDRVNWQEAWDLFPGDAAYVWHGGTHSAEVQLSLEKAGFQMRAQIIWAKQHFVFGRGDYHWQHEPCWYAVRKGKKGHWAGDRKQSTLWEINNNNPFGTGGSAEEKLGHSTQKPVECMKRPIENNSVQGDTIYEPFSGSGTTIIAGETLGRSVLAMELNPLYVDMAVIRWQNFTGKESVHAETGERFNDRSAPLKNNSSDIMKTSTAKAKANAKPKK